MKITIVLPNIRSAWNIGSIFRTCDALGFEIILAGYTARPIGKSLDLIKKTAIGAENTVKWQYFEHPISILEAFPSEEKRQHLGIEINSTSLDLYDYLQKIQSNIQPNKTKFQSENILNSKDKVSEKVENKSFENLELEYFLWFGNEISGLESKVMANLDAILHLPMNGSKESLNIANCVCACGYLFDYITKNSQMK